MFKVKAKGALKDLLTATGFYYGTDKDLNDLVEDGFYKVNNLVANKPDADNYYWVRVWACGDDYFQEAFKISNPPEVWARNGFKDATGSKVWGQWVKTGGFLVVFLGLLENLFSGVLYVKNKAPERNQEPFNRFGYKLSGDAKINPDWRWGTGRLTLHHYRSASRCILSTAFAQLCDRIDETLHSKPKWRLEFSQRGLAAFGGVAHA